MANFFVMTTTYHIIQFAGYTSFKKKLLRNMSTPKLIPPFKKKLVFPLYAKEIHELMHVHALIILLWIEIIQKLNERKSCASFKKFNCIYFMN